MYKLIKLQEGYIIVLAKKQKVDSITKWYYEEDNNIQCYQFSKEALPKEYYLQEIIASNFIPELPNIDFNNLEEEFGIVDVEKLAVQYDKENGNSYNSELDYYEAGFNKCLELNKDKLYTEEQVLKAVKMAKEKDRVVLHQSDYSDYLYNNDEIIQSLQPKTEWNIEVEMNSCSEDIGICALGCIGNCKPKITNNQIKIINIL